MPQNPDSVQRKLVDWLWLYHSGVYQGAGEAPARAFRTRTRTSSTNLWSDVGI